MSNFPVLSAILFVPLLGAIGALLLPRLVGWGWALLASLVDLALALALIPRLGTSNTQMLALNEHLPWLPDAGINYTLSADGINLFLLSLNALLTLIAIGASFNIVRAGDRPRQYLTLMMLFSFGMQGVFLATNLFLFYVFWEVMLIPAYLLVGMFGGPRRSYAAIKFVLYTTAGSVLMLVGIIATGIAVSGAHNNAYTLDLAALLNAGVPSHPQVALFLAFAAAFAVKTGMFPLHGWVPDAYSESPIPVVVLIAGVMAKTGVYGFVRFCLPLFPQAVHTLTPLMETLAVVGILYFALQALVAVDFVRLLAYVSISHLSVIVLGIFALNVAGIEGGVVQMINHGIVIAALFLIAGAIEARTGTRRLADFGALATKLPWLAAVFLIAAMSALGLPGLNSFAGEFLAFLGTFQSSVLFGTLGTLVVIPAAWYMLRFFQGAMEGITPEGNPVANARLTDLRVGEWLPLLPL
ncbi:MAG TPA: NADH-quinone oxidoreductase subunit M, partial [Ktedonobacterales bacterium]|nr:NADH-quinone oxidoreductase subunit M [Ktedonobacterales bacterium]